MIPVATSAPQFLFGLSWLLVLSSSLSSPCFSGVVEVAELPLAVVAPGHLWPVHCWVACLVVEVVGAAMMEVAEDLAVLVAAALEVEEQGAHGN
jgi:hypothetical protein